MTVSDVIVYPCLVLQVYEIMVSTITTNILKCERTVSNAPVGDLDTIDSVRIRYIT